MVAIKETLKKAAELEKLKGVGIILDAMYSNNMAVEEGRRGLMIVKEIDEALSLELLDAIFATDKLIEEARQKLRERIRQAAGVNGDQAHAG